MPFSLPNYLLSTTNYIMNVSAQFSTRVENNTDKIKRNKQLTCVWNKRTSISYSIANLQKSYCKLVCVFW
jgi:hypothetical protein